MLMQTTSYQVKTLLKKWNNLKLLASQQQFFMWACESNEYTTKASYEVAMLIAKHGKPFTFFVKNNVRRDCLHLSIFTLSNLDLFVQVWTPLINTNTKTEIDRAQI